MSIKKNILSNYVGTALAVLTPILALPWYISSLGATQFGLIGFITTLQGVLSLLDAGISQALVREIALRYDMKDTGQRKTASLLVVFERLYWAFALCLGFIVILLANTISTHWLKLDDSYIETGTIAIYGAGAIFAVQFPGSLYRSFLIGTQAQLTLNAITSTWSILRHIGGVIAVTVYPTLLSYVIWHAITALLETLTRRQYTWRLLKTNADAIKLDFDELKLIWRQFTQMTAAVLLSSLAMQLDKIILSRMVNIEDFGYYLIASTASIGSLQLIYPLTQAILPRAIQLRNNPAALKALDLNFAKIIAVLAGCYAIIFASAGEWLLQVWLRNSETVVAVYPIFCFLLAGTLFNAFYNVGYINWLANGKIYRLLQVNLLSIFFSILLIPPMITHWGTIGAATGWVISNVVGFLLSLEWLKRFTHEKDF